MDTDTAFLLFVANYTHDLPLLYSIAEQGNLTSAQVAEQLNLPLSLTAPITIPELITYKLLVPRAPLYKIQLVNITTPYMDIVNALRSKYIPAIGKARIAPILEDILVLIFSHNQALSPLRESFRDYQQGKNGALARAFDQSIYFRFRVYQYLNLTEGVPMPSFVTATREYVEDSDFLASGPFTHQVSSYLSLPELLQLGSAIKSEKLIDVQLPGRLLEALADLPANPALAVEMYRLEIVNQYDLNALLAEAILTANPAMVKALLPILGIGVLNRTVQALTRGDRVTLTKYALLSKTDLLYYDEETFSPIIGWLNLPDANVTQKWEQVKAFPTSEGLGIEMVRFISFITTLVPARVRDEVTSRVWADLIGPLPGAISTLLITKNPLSALKMTRLPSYLSFLKGNGLIAKRYRDIKDMLRSSSISLENLVAFLGEVGFTRRVRIL